jgi:hypothetical protein
MVQVTLPDQTLSFRDLRLLPNLANRRLTTSRDLANNHNPRETNPDSRLKKRRCPLQTANSNSSRARAEYWDSSE